MNRQTTSEILKDSMIDLGRTGVIGRFKPLHNGGAMMLEAICRQAAHVTIGIGSSNKYNIRNPFTAAESEEMVRAFLADSYANYDIIHIPDFAHVEKLQGNRTIHGEAASRASKTRAPFQTAALKPQRAHRVLDIAEYKDGKKWKEYVVQAFGPRDSFVSSNGYVRGLLGDVYQLVAPSALIPPEHWIELRATAVRVAIAQGDAWKSLVPEKVAEYLETRHLIKRFRDEFGLQTLAALAGDPATIYEHERAGAEALHAQEI